MDGAPGPTPKAGSGGKAVLPMPAEIIDAGAATSSARGALKVTLPGSAAAASDAPAAATAAPDAAVSNDGREAEDEDDEQVERFYALLDNIRAMRGAYVFGSGDGTGAALDDDGVVDPTGGGGGGARAKKRLRGSEPPWRPTFRLEDFEEPTPTSSSSSDAAPCTKRTRGQEADGEGSGGARPEVAAAVARVWLDGGRKSV